MFYGADPYYTARVKCPVCSFEWEDRFSNDVTGEFCRNCHTELEIEVTFTLKEKSK